MARQHTRLPHLSSWEEGRGDNEQLRSVHILSLLCKKESDLALLFWLQPLQPAVLSEDFNDNDDADDEKRVLELAWRLHLLLLHYFLFYQRVNYHSFLLGVSLSSTTPDCPHGRPQNQKGSNKSSAFFPGKVFLVSSFVPFPCAGDKIWLSVTL